MITNYLKLAANINKLIRYTYSSSFFKQKTQTKEDQQSQIDSILPSEGKKKKLFGAKQSSTTVFDKFQKIGEKNENLDDLIKKINESNRYFLGVKYNTNYLKVNKIVKYEDIQSLKADRVTINDIPIQLSKKTNQDMLVFDKYDQQDALNQKSAKIAFSKSRFQPTLASMTKIIKNFILKLSKKQKLENVEPNFQVHIIKVLNGLSQKVQLRLRNEEADPQIKIKNITLLKGLSVYRNDNYSTDSFEKSQESQDGIIHYRLYEQGKDGYPQIEWASTKKINARFELLVKGGPIIDVLDSGNLIGSTQNVVHSVVIQTDMLPPPAISQYQLTQEDYLKSYRIQYNNLLLTNVDRKNAFYPLTYSQIQKQNNLINRII